MAKRLYITSSLLISFLLISAAPDARADEFEAVLARCPSIAKESKEIFANKKPPFDPLKETSFGVKPLSPLERLKRLMRTYGAQLRAWISLGADPLPGKPPARLTPTEELSRLEAAASGFDCFLSAIPPGALDYESLFSIQAERMNINISIGHLFNIEIGQQRKRLLNLFKEIDNFINEVKNQKISKDFEAAKRDRLLALEEQLYYLRLAKIGLFQIALVGPVDPKKAKELRGSAAPQPERRIPFTVETGRQGDRTTSQLRPSLGGSAVLVMRDSNEPIALNPDGFFHLPRGKHRLLLTTTGYYEDRPNHEKDRHVVQIREEQFSLEAECEKPKPWVCLSEGEERPDPGRGLRASRRCGLLGDIATRMMPLKQALAEVRARQPKPPLTPDGAKLLDELLDEQEELMAEGKRCVSSAQEVKFELRKKHWYEYPAVWGVAGGVAGAAVITGVMIYLFKPPTITVK